MVVSDVLVYRLLFAVGGASLFVALPVIIC